MPELDRWLASLFTVRTFQERSAPWRKLRRPDIDPGRANMLDAACQAPSPTVISDSPSIGLGSRRAWTLGWSPNGLLRCAHRGCRPSSSCARRRKSDTTEAEISGTVGGFRDIVKTLRRADPASSAAVHRGTLASADSMPPYSGPCWEKPLPNMGDLSCRGGLELKPAMSAAASRTFDLRHG